MNPVKVHLADELDVLDQVAHIEKHLIELGISVYRKGITQASWKKLRSLRQKSLILSLIL